MNELNLHNQNGVLDLLTEPVPKQADPPYNLLYISISLSLFTKGVANATSLSDQHGVNRLKTSIILDG